MKAPQAGDPADLIRQVPSGHRDRLTIAWPGAATNPPASLISAARDAGFIRVRIVGPATQWTVQSLRTAVSAGLNEVELILDGAGPFETLRDLRATGGLAFVALRTVPGACGDPVNPCQADAFVLEIPPDGPGPGDDICLGIASTRFRLLAVRGWPLCSFPSLVEKQVVSNAFVAELDDPISGSRGGRLRVPFEDPARIFTEACGSCRLSLACDGLPVAAVANGAGGRLDVRPFGPGPGSQLSLGPAGLLSRLHPPTFLTGRIHVLGVEAGIRPCGRIVVDAADAVRQAQVIETMGLRTCVVSQPAAPKDRDAGAGARGVALQHVFFSKGDEAQLAADLQTRFAGSQDGDRPMDAAVFARELGLLLGYPTCCIDAFASAGPHSSTSDLIAAARRRSGDLRWELNVLDPVSPFTLVPHIPCRFDCSASLELATRVISVLDSVFPFLAGAAEHALRRNWLWWDATRSIAFDGVIDPDGQGCSCNYPDSGLQRVGIRSSVESLAFLQRLLPLILGSDHVRIEGTKARGFRGGLLVGEMGDGAGEPVIFSFQG
jgi:hypothetical protein